MMLGSAQAPLKAMRCLLTQQFLRIRRFLVRGDLGEAFAHGKVPDNPIFLGFRRGKLSRRLQASAGLPQRRP